MSIQMIRRNVISNAALSALPVFVAASLVLMPAPQASAAVTLTYDADTATTGVQDGAGAGWNVAADPANWWNGTADVKWSSSNTIADTAIFGSGSSTGLAASANVVVGTVNVGTIQYNLASAGGAVGYNLTTGTITLGSGITNNGATGTSSISAKITGTSGLAFVGVAGSSVNNTLSGANDYTGLTTASTGGRLVAGSNTALGVSTGATASTLGTDYTQVNSGATVVVNGGLTTFNEALVLNGAGSASAGALRVNGSNTFGSLIQLNSASSIVFNGASGNIFNGNIAMGANTLTVSSGSTTIANTFNGVISGSAGITFINNGQVDFLTNANNYSGITSNGANTLGLGNDAALGTSTLNFAGGGVESTTAAPRTLANVVTFNAGTGAVFGTIAGQSAPVGTGALTFTSTTAMDLGTTAHALATNADVTFAAGFSGTTGSITKTGNSALILNGTSSYTGGTAVNAGTLGGIGTLSGSLVTIGTAGTLTGATTGTTGTLTLGNGATFSGAATYLADLTSTSSDLLAITGVLDLSSLTDVLTLQGTASLPSYTLATYTSLTGTFNTVNGLPSGYELQYNPTSIDLVATPEPAALGLLSVVAGLGLKRRRQS